MGAWQELLNAEIQDTSDPRDLDALADQLVGALRDVTKAQAARMLRARLDSVDTQRGGPRSAAMAVSAPNGESAAKPAAKKAAKKAPAAAAPEGDKAALMDKIETFVKKNAPAARGDIAKNVGFGADPKSAKLSGALKALKDAKRVKMTGTLRNARYS